MYDRRRRPLLVAASLFSIVSVDRSFSLCSPPLLLLLLSMLLLLLLMLLLLIGDKTIRSLLALDENENKNQKSTTTTLTPFLCRNNLILLFTFSSYEYSCLL